MKKEFNVTGNCNAKEHYMMDNGAKLQNTIELVKDGKYFTINRPRQYGKTTTLDSIAKMLRKQEDYLPIELNFQGVDSMWHESDKAFAAMFCQHLIDFFEFNHPDIYTFLIAQKETVEDMGRLSKVITRLVLKLNKKVVLLIDEVDASSKYEPFLSFLGMLRNKYLARHKPYQATFHSVILVGVHDIKSLKYRLRNPNAAQYNSPWNIATDFDVDMSFNPKEIAPMLVEYCEAEGVTMDISAIADRLHYHTSGYPFLVCKICRNIVDKILKHEPERKNWTLEDVEKAVQILLKEDNVNFDSLIKNLRNHKDLYQLVFRVVFFGDTVTFNPDNPVIKKGVLYGVFKRNGNVKIHNRVYAERIYNALVSDKEIQLYADDYNHRHQFDLSDNALDIQRVLERFQQFIKEQYSDKDRSFLEREWRLLFLAFLQPILNGVGYTFKESQISAEKRLDVVITYFQHRYIIELKKWYGQVYHEKGIVQLADYLEIHGLKKGYLIIFDNRKNKEWATKWIEHDGKKIFAVWI